LEELDMRKWIVLAAAASLVLGAAGLAGAAPLNWSGTATVVIADIPAFVVYGGGVATVNDSAGGVPAHLSTLRLKGSRGQVVGTDTQFITDPDEAGNGIAAVIVHYEGGTGTFAPISGGAESTSVLTRNIMPVYGMAKICLLSTVCTLYLEMSFTQPTTVNGVPGSGVYGVGIGGLLTAGGYGGIRLSMQGAPWTIKTITVVDHLSTPGGSQIFTEQTAKGWAHAPASTTSSTAQVSGVLQLVMPAQLESNIPLGANDKLSGIVSMVIHFIPEPGLLLLLGSGVVGLAVLGRRRMR
jgi:hypothetical protein